MKIPEIAAVIKKSLAENSLNQEEIPYDKNLSNITRINNYWRQSPDKGQDFAAAYILNNFFPECKIASVNLEPWGITKQHFFNIIKLDTEYVSLDLCYNLLPKDFCYHKIYVYDQTQISFSSNVTNRILDLCLIVNSKLDPREQITLRFK